MDETNRLARWRLSLPFVTALLLSLAFHPADIGPLAWVALVPLIFYILKETSFWRLALLLWAGGIVFFCAGLFWVHFVTWAGLIVLSLILGGYFVLFGLVIKLIQRRFGAGLFFLAIPAWWVFTEYLRAYLFTGFPWLFLGHTQHGFLTLIQIVDLTGVYGVSFLAVCVNSLLTFILTTALDKERRWKRLMIPSIALLVMLSAALGYGYFRAKSIIITAGPLVGIVQGNVPQDLKISHNTEDIEAIYQRHLTLSGELKKARNPELIIWAETMYPYLVEKESQSLAELKAIPRSCRTDMIIGAVSNDAPEGAKYELYNSAYFVSAGGDLIGRYDKIHLVPVSEALPLRETFPWLEDLVLSVSGLKELLYLRPGQSLAPLPWKGYKVGILICYESIFPALSRASVTNGADFIVNISNDGWFKDGAELEQILIISVFRAIENRVGFIRATNTGISAFISPLGELTILKDAAGRIKETEGTLARRVDLGPKNTLYNRWGDYFPWLAIALFGTIGLLKFLAINLTK